VNTGATVIKNTVILSIGQFVTLGTGVVFTGILSRHIGPAGYGQYAFAMSTVAILMILVELGFGNLTIRAVAQRRDEAPKYFENIVFIKVLVATAVIAAYLLVAWLGNGPREMRILVLVMGVNMTLDSITLTAGTIFFAYEQMKYDVIARVIRSLVALGLGAGMIALGYDLIAITSVVVLANIAKLAISLSLLSRKITRLRFRIDLGFCRYLVAASLPFALLLVVNVVFSNVGIIMLGTLTSEIVVGWFASAVRITDMLLIIPGMLLTALYPVLSKSYASSTESLGSSYGRAFHWGLILGMPMAAGVFLTADEIVGLVFGPGFENASSVLRLMSLVIGVSFCNNINGATLSAMGKERFFAALSTLTVTVVAITNWWLIPVIGYPAVAITQIVAVGAGFIIYSVLCHQWLGLRLPWATAARSLLATSLMAICVFLALRIGASLVVLVLLIGPVTYMGAVRLLGLLSGDDFLYMRRALRFVYLSKPASEH